MPRDFQNQLRREVRKIAVSVLIGEQIRGTPGVLPNCVLFGCSVYRSARISRLALRWLCYFSMKRR